MYCTDAELKEIVDKWLEECGYQRGIFIYKKGGLYPKEVDQTNLMMLFEAVTLKEVLKRSWGIQKCTCTECQEIEKESEEDDHRKLTLKRDHLREGNIPNQDEEKDND